MRVAFSTIAAWTVSILIAPAMIGSTSTARAQVADTPDTPFKLATFEAFGQVGVGMVLGDSVIQIQHASANLAESMGLPRMSLPNEMRALIEGYDTLAPRLYQIANHYAATDLDGLPFVFDLDDVSIKAPIKYPWNVLSVAANYKAHAEGMAEEDAGGGPPAGFDASVVDQIVPERDAPVMFAKSPRSTIIDPGEPYYIPPGRDQIDWEGEMAIIMGTPAYLVDREDAHDYVFGYSIMYDVSDRGGRTREVSMFPGPNWFDGKSTNRGAPFGPFIVPKEFLPNHESLRLVTRVNGEIKQDQTTADLIWNEANLIAFATSILELYPGDVIASGTPSGTAREHDPVVYLKPGDVVTIELEGVGTLETPIEAWPGR